MAKILVLLHGSAGNDPRLAAAAEALAAGAREVRFAEVALRRLDGDAGVKESGEAGAAKVAGPDAIETLTSADALVLVGGAGGGLDGALAEAGSLTDRVAAAVGPDGAPDWGTLQALAARGAILVPQPASRHHHDHHHHGHPEPAPSSPLHALGARVARVAGWVRHAKSHEH